MSRSDEIAQQAAEQRARVDDRSPTDAERLAAALEATMLNAAARRAREAGE